MHHRATANCVLEPLPSRSQPLRRPPAKSFRLTSRHPTSYTNGQVDEPGLIGGEGWCLFSLREMAEQWQRWSNSRDRDRLPIAWGAMGDHIFLDLQDSEQPGRVMVQRADSDEPDPVAPSFRAWLEDFANKLDNDEFAYSASDGCVMYADEVDIE